MSKIVNTPIPFIPRPEEHEYFQRRYGLDTTHVKDTRNLIQTKVVTDFMIAEMRVKKVFIFLALKQPVGGITPSLVEIISEISGIKSSIVVEVLRKNFPHGSIGAFLASYFEMDFAGREYYRDFEESTANIFRELFKFQSTWLGSASSGKEVHDILLVSDEAGFQAIIDSKSYSRFPLAFFSYIAGGFSSTIANHIQEISNSSSINGSAVLVTIFIKMVEQQSQNLYSHAELKNIFSLNRMITINDLKDF